MLVKILVPSDSYACHKNFNQHRPGNTDPCPGDPVGELVRTFVQWETGIVESGPRDCFAQLVQTNFSNGEYACELKQPAGAANQVVYDIGDDFPRYTGRKNGDPTLCSVFVGPVFLTPNRLYDYGWGLDGSGGCADDDGCTIQIDNWFQGVEVIILTGERADFIRLRAWGDVGPTLGPNPFDQDLPVVVDEIHITFFANGSNKKIAECTYDHPDNVTFFSEPD